MFNATFNNISAISWRSVISIVNIPLFADSNFQEICNLTLIPMQSVPITTNIVSSNPIQANIDFLENDWFGFMMLNATFNNISAISWRSVLLVEETGLPWKRITRQL
jgi:hypothetical protein